LLASIISFAAVTAFEQRALSRETLHKYRELIQLHETTAQIARSLATEEVARVAIDRAMQTIKATGGAIMLCSEEQNALRLVARSGDNDHPNRIVHEEKSIAALVMKTGKAEIVNDVYAEPRDIEGDGDVHSMMCAPLVSKGKTIGVFTISSHEPFMYLAEDLKLLQSIASQTATALTNAQLFEQLRVYSDELEKKNMQLQKEITRRTQTEKALRKTEEKYRLHFDNVLDVIYSVDADFKIIAISPSVEKIMGYAPEELIGRPFTELNLMTEDSLKRARADTMRIMGGERIESAEYEFIAKNGSIKTGEVSSAPLFENGRIISIFSVARDITERIRTRQALIESEERFRTMAENITNGLIIMENGKTVYVNDRACEISGYSRDELMGKWGPDLAAPEESARKEQIIREVRMTGSLPEEIDVWMQRKDGSRCCVNLRFSSTGTDTRHYAGYVVITDITERKKTEESLRAATKFLDNIIENSLDCIVVGDKRGTLVRVNRYFCELLGYDAKDVLGKHMSEFTATEKGAYDVTTGESIEITQGYLDRQVQTVSLLREEKKVANWETYLIRKDGRLIPGEVNINYLYDEDGKRTGAVGIVRDSTERKKAEKEITETRDFLENLIDNSLDMIVIADAKGYIRRVNKKYVQSLGMQVEELRGKHMAQCAPDTIGTYELVSGEAIELTEEFFDSQVAMIDKLLKEKMVANWKSFYCRRDGKVIPVEQNIFYLFSESGEIVASVGIVRDITERKKAEAEILVTRDFLQNVITTALDGIVVTDALSTITMINQAAVNIFGYSQEELLGHRIQGFLAVGGEVEERGKQIQKILMEKRTVYGYEHTWRRKDGTFVDLEMSIALLEDHKKGLAGSVLSLRDITERKQAEKKILDYQNQLRSMASQLTLTEEQERRSIATDLHDRIGQTLAIAKIKLGALRAAAAPLGFDADVDAVRDLVEQSIQDTRSLIFDLCPPFLYELGFEKALEWLLEDIQEQYGIATHFECDGKPYQLDDDLRILLYQSVRELFINIVKHAQAQHARLSVQSDPAGLNLFVEDDGRGFDAPASAFHFDKEGGFGLFRIQERLHYLGGAITIDSKPHQGTRISLVLPFKSREHPCKEDVQ
jgi:PAS domain S-box-containing protein